MFRTCPIDVPYLKRYETYMRHIWDIYGTSYPPPLRNHGFTEALRFGDGW
jgi:hypothetical protein